MIDTLPRLFDDRRPERDAVLLELPGGTTITYGQADDQAARIANGLMAAGVRPGDRLAVHVEKAPEVVSLWLACVKAGVIFLPMNPAYTTDEAAGIVADAAPALVVRSVEEILALADGRSDAFTQFAVAPDDVAALLYTSGTTGRPKGAMLTHRNLATNATALRDAWGFGPDDRLLHALPIFHAHGLFVALDVSLANGTPLVFLPRFDVDDVLEHLPRCTVFMGVPTHYTRLLADPRLDRGRCADVRLFVSGSAPLLASTHEAFTTRTGHEILERYGMTETVMNTSNPLVGARKPGTVGPPLPGVELRLAAVDDAGIGSIELRGPNVFPGYWHRPELTATEFTPDGFFRTGDLGTIDADGYLSIVGRSKDLVISGGLNVYPKEVEDVLDLLDGVLESAVVGLPDADLGEAVVAVVVAREGAVLDPDALRARARERLAGFKVPKRVVLVDALPRNALGKVEKAAIRANLA